MKKIIKWSALSCLSALMLIVITIAVFLNTAPWVSAAQGLETEEKMEKAGNYNGGEFRNSEPTPMSFFNRKMLGAMWEFVKGDPTRTPDYTLATAKFDKQKFISAPDSQISASWFGHSTVIFRTAGKTFITDPVFSERASMVSFAGPKRFDYQHRPELDSMPRIDVVIISHNHYDHLDCSVIETFGNKVEKYFVPLGVGAYLTKWGVDSSRVVELNWWEEYKYSEDILVCCTPSRHFSGRGLSDRNETLWCSWIVTTKDNNIFFSGDSGYGKHFAEIGNKYGPFDLSFMENGAYHPNWSNIHMMPEESVRAGLDIGSRLQLPIHWGKFALSLHSWQDPINRCLKAARGEGLDIITPKPGQVFVAGIDNPRSKWWLEKAEALTEIEVSE